MALCVFDLANDRGRALRLPTTGSTATWRSCWTNGVAPPGDDLISAVLSTEDHGDRLSHAEVLMLVENFPVGGTDTTRHPLALALWALARCPDQWELLAADPSLVPRAVEGSLRWEGDRRRGPASLR